MRRVGGRSVKILNDCLNLIQGISPSGRIEVTILKKMSFILDRVYAQDLIGKVSLQLECPYIGQVRLRDGCNKE